MLSVLLLVLGAVAPTLGDFYGPHVVTHIDPHFNPHYAAHKPMFNPQPAYGLPMHEPAPCYPKTLYDTIFKTDYEKVPVYSTVFKPKYIPTTYYDTIYKTQFETKVVPEYIPQYITETKFVNKYRTEVEFKTIFKTEYESIYLTKTIFEPEYITKTDYVTQYETRYQPQYITETEVQPVHKTKVIYKTKILYQTKYVEKPVVHKPIYEGNEKYGSFGGGSGYGGHDFKLGLDHGIHSKLKSGGGGTFKLTHGTLGLEDGLKHDEISFEDYFSLGGGLGPSLKHEGLASGLNFGGDVKHGELGFDESLKFTDEPGIVNDFKKLSGDSHLAGNLKLGSGIDGKLGSNLALGLDHLPGFGRDTTKLGGALGFSSSNLGPGFDPTKTGSGLGFEEAFASGFGDSGLHLESLGLEHSLDGLGFSDFDLTHAGPFALGKTEMDSFGFRDVKPPIPGIKTLGKGPTGHSTLKSPFTENFDGLAGVDSFSLSDRFKLLRGNMFGGSLGFRRRREGGDSKESQKDD